MGGGIFIFWSFIFLNVSIRKHLFRSFIYSLTIFQQYLLNFYYIQDIVLDSTRRHNLQPRSWSKKVILKCVQSLIGKTRITFRETQRGYEPANCPQFKKTELLPLVILVILLHIKLKHYHPYWSGAHIVLLTNWMFTYSSRSVWTSTFFFFF